MDSYAFACFSAMPPRVCHGYGSPPAAAGRNQHAQGNAVHIATTTPFTAGMNPWFCISKKMPLASCSFDLD
jgi:hypothetical protein